MRPYELCQKYGKAFGKKIIELAYNNRLNELINDISSLEYVPPAHAGKCIIVPTAQDAAEIHSKHDHLHIVSLGGLVEPYNNVSFEDLNTQQIEGIDAQFLVIFNDSPESHVTYDLLVQKYPTKVFERAQYGLSAANPFKTDEYTQRKVLREYIIEQQ